MLPCLWNPFSCTQHLVCLSASQTSPFLIHRPSKSLNRHWQWMKVIERKGGQGASNITQMKTISRIKLSSVLDSALQTWRAHTLLHPFLKGYADMFSFYMLRNSKYKEVRIHSSLLIVQEEGRDWGNERNVENHSSWKWTVTKYLWWLKHLQIIARFWNKTIATTAKLALSNLFLLVLIGVVGAEWIGIFQWGEKNCVKLKEGFYWIDTEIHAWKHMKS